MLWLLFSISRIKTRKVEKLKPAKSVDLHTSYITCRTTHCLLLPHCRYGFVALEGKPAANLHCTSWVNFYPNMYGNAPYSFDFQSLFMKFYDFLYKVSAHTVYKNWVFVSPNKKVNNKQSCTISLYVCHGCFFHPHFYKHHLHFLHYGYFYYQHLKEEKLEHTLFPMSWMKSTTA